MDKVQIIHEKTCHQIAVGIAVAKKLDMAMALVISGDKIDMLKHTGIMAKG